MIQLEPVPPIIINPSMEHTATIEVKDNITLAVREVDANETAFSFTSLMPAIFSALLEHTARSSDFCDGCL
jgi:hypothetical protein